MTGPPWPILRSRTLCFNLKKRFRLARDFSLRQRYATLVINDKKKPLKFNQQQNGSWVANQVDSYQPMLYLLSNQQTLQPGSRWNMFQSDVFLEIGSAHQTIMDKLW